VERRDYGVLRGTILKRTWSDLEESWNVFNMVSQLLFKLDTSQIQVTSNNLFASYQVGNSCAVSILLKLIHM